VLRINNITSEAIQRHSLVIDDLDIDIILRFLPSVEIWLLDVEFEGRVLRGLKLSAGVTHIRGANMPFDFVVTIEDNSGIDPFRISDFELGRCELYYVTVDDMTALRGQEVR